MITFCTNSAFDSPQMGLAFSDAKGDGKVPVASSIEVDSAGNSYNTYDFGNLDGLGHKKHVSSRCKTAPTTQGESTMNLWQISLPGKCKRFAASQAEARELRQLFMDEFKVTKKNVTVEPCEVPTRKQELIEFLNVAYAQIDAPPVQE